MTTSPAVLVTRQGAIATLTLNRPEKRNALSLDVMLEIIAALQAIATGMQLMK
jgi:enoyl-CoA hydratase/carnithine racemase